jgi:hypothetical protein
MITVNNTCNRVSNVKPYTDVIPWKEMFEIHASEETWLDECLEAFDGGESGVSRGAARVATPMPAFQRPEMQVAKQARVAQKWDREVGDMKSHVSSIMSQIGNARRG